MYEHLRVATDDLLHALTACIHLEAVCSLHLSVLPGHIDFPHSCLPVSAV